MLVIKAYINYGKIDEIHIWNTGICIDDEKNMYEYQIVKPKGFENLPIDHKQDDGYISLLIQALKTIEENGDNSKKCVACGEKTENKIVDKPICIDCMASISMI